MSKLGILIKNNLKLILRNRAMLVVSVLGVLVTVAALSNAFHSLLDSAEDAGGFTLGYRIAEGSSYADFEGMLVSSLEEEGILCVRYGGEDPAQLVEDGKVQVFLDFLEDDYHIYGSSKREIQLRSIQYALFMATENLRAQMSGAASGALPEAKELETYETAGAQDYYSMIEIIYFLSLSMVYLTFTIQTERGSQIWFRYAVGDAGSAALYFGKMIPCVLTSWLFLGLISGGLVTVLFDVHWGNPLVVFPLLGLEAVAFTAFGMVFLLLFRNMAVAIGLEFMILWFMGFAGGTFETYMYSSVPNRIKELSPLYYLNRTIVEYSTMGGSAYLSRCVLVLLAITVVSVPAGILLTKRKRGC